MNDVDVTEFVEAELDRRHPERAQLRDMKTADDYRAMWDTIECLWSETVARARRLPEGARNERVDDLALIVDLVVTGWRSIDERLARIEEMLGYDERPMLPVSPSEAAPAGRAAAA